MSSELTAQNIVFDQILHDYLESWCRFHPEQALDAGIEQYANQLQPHDDETISILIALQEKCLTALDEIDIHSLDNDRQLNYQILHGWAVLQHHNLMEHDWRYRQPDLFLPINAIHQLTIRPVTDFAGALLGRLTAIPGLLRAGKQYLYKAPALIPPVWLTMAQQECSAGISMFQELAQHPLVSEAISKNSDIRPAISDATVALKGFSAKLEQLQSQSSGDFACGREHFERLLQHRHFLPINAHTLFDFGEKLFTETRQQLAEELQQSALTLADIQQHHPEQSQLLAAYQQEMQAAQQFLLEHELVSIPEVQKLKVVSTPEFLQQQIPFAAYMEPSIADLEQTAYYYVTPVNNTDELAEHNFAAIAQTSIHEAWPGHHLQFVTANQSATGSTLLRRLTPNSTLYEGWALYCEQMMLEQGFERYPGQKIIMLRDRLWRALRIMIDVGIHTGRLSIDQASQQLVDELGFSHDQAMAELRWYSLAPTVPMSYAVGWALLNALREIVAPANAQELKQFHDKILSCGSVALSLVIQSQFGQQIWQRCCQDVFGEMK